MTAAAEFARSNLAAAATASSWNISARLFVRLKRAGTFPTSMLTTSVPEELGKWNELALLLLLLHRLASDSFGEFSDGVHGRDRTSIRCHFVPSSSQHRVGC